MIAPVIETIIAQIKAVVATPNVYDYLPMQADMTLFKDLVTHGGRLHFYTVTRPSAGIGQRGANFVAFDHIVNIEGRIAFQDSATQRLIDAELDAILLAIVSQSPGSNVTGIERLQLAENKPYSYYNQAVHYGRIELEVRIV